MARKKKTKAEPEKPPEPEKQVSRQRRWQIKRVEAGYCMICSRKRRHYTSLCDVCQELRKRRYRKRGLWKKWEPGGPGRTPYIP